MDSQTSQSTMHSFLHADMPWSSYPHSVELRKNNVHIWAIELDQFSYDSKDLDLLSKDEQARAERLVGVEKRAQFTASRIALRKILSRYTGLAPENIRFDYAESGKPSIATQAQLDPIEFNLSHSKNTMLLAVTRRLNVGIDIEKIAPITNIGRIAENYYSSDDAAFLKHCGSADRLSLFYRLWTLKEAHSKCSGLGFSKAPAANYSILFDRYPLTGKEIFQTHSDGSWMYSSQIAESYAFGLVVRSQSKPNFEFFLCPDSNKLDRFRQHNPLINHNCPV